MSQLKAMNQALEKAKDVKDVFTLDFVSERAIKSYEAVTGRKDANQWYQAEVMAMMTLFAEKPDLKKCDKMSIWGCLMTAGRLGLSIADQQIDLIPYNNVLKAEPNYKGMRDQLRRMPDVVFISEAQVVYKGEEFIHDKLANKITRHDGKLPPKEINLDTIIAAYVRIEFKGQRIQDVVMYQHELVAAKARSKNQGGPWTSNTGEMCKKSVVKRAKKIYYVPSTVELSDTEFKKYEASEDEPITQDVAHTEVAPETTVPSPAAQPTQAAEPTKVAGSAMDEFLGG